MVHTFRSSRITEGGSHFSGSYWKYSLRQTHRQMNGQTHRFQRDERGEFVLVRNHQVIEVPQHLSSLLHKTKHLKVTSTRGCSLFS